MSAGLRVGIASQTPYARPKRTLEELEREYGPLGDPVPLDKLQRTADYSVTPGGVARMVASAVPRLSSAGRVASADWVTLSTGFPKDFQLDVMRIASAELPPERREGYGRFKEIVWEALNGLHTTVTTPLRLEGEVAAARDDFLVWSEENARVLRARDAESPFDVLYINDWQHLPQGRLLKGRPKVFHHHAPIAEWTPPGWKEWFLHYARDFEALMVSTPSYKTALETMGYERPVHVVLPWLDPADYPHPRRSEVEEFSERFDIDPDDEVVLNVGRMDPVKGQDRLIRAMPRLLKKRPDARLLLVGNGSFSSSKKAGMGLSKGKKWRNWLEALVKNLGVEDRVTFTGHIPHRDALAAFERADVFTFPSVGEGFGLAVVEAWLYGKPTVVDPRAGVSEFIANGENGQVVDARDPIVLADALAEILSDDRAAELMGRNGRKAASMCDANVNAFQLAEILEAYAERRAPDLPVVAREPR